MVAHFAISCAGRLLKNGLSLLDRSMRSSELLVGAGVGLTWLPCLSDAMRINCSSGGRATGLPIFGSAIL
jgi:hypothetical protein